MKDEGRKGRKNEVAYEHEAFLISNLIRIVVRRSKREARANRQGPRCHAHVLHFTIVQRSALPERRTWLLLDYSSINLPPSQGYTSFSRSLLIPSTLERSTMSQTFSISFGFVPFPSPFAFFRQLTQGISRISFFRRSSRIKFFDHRNGEERNRRRREGTRKRIVPTNRNR